MLYHPLVLALGLRTALAASPAAPAPATIPDETPIHLGISLRIAHPEALAALQKAQQDPASPEYKQWITPEEFGERFGQPAEVYAAAVAWVSSVGLSVKQFPNRTFLEASGKASQVTRLLGVHLVRVDSKSVAVHVPDGQPKLPPALAPVILNISGLDTRIKYRHHISETDGYPASFGPQDLRRFYGVQPLLDQGFVGQGQQLVVLSTAEPAGSEASPADIEYFFQNISDARTPFVQHVLPNPQNDVDNEAGGGLEFELDCEMQSVGCPGADSITLEISPASEVFTTGANDIVSTFPSATAASVSLGNCEEAEEQSAAGQNEAATLRQAIQQGAVQGMSFSAASGDNGSDDCQQPSVGPSVDFPASIPEVVAAGGSQVNNPAWDANNALTAWQTEVVWGQVGATGGGGAGGGGVSTFYTPAPAYQAGLGLSGRGVPDIALIAGLPGVTTCSSLPGQLSPVEGTSIASPLSAGFLALISSRLGCHTGDPHIALYALGNAQADGGVAVYHDITSGNNSLDGVPGYDAGPGYDVASGWGSLNVAAIAAAWPACPFNSDAGLFDGGAVDAGLDAGPVVGGPAYAQCTFIGCEDAGCTTLPEGPSSCSPICNAENPASCDVSGEICTNDVIYGDGGTGSCVPGCLQDSDCPVDAGSPVCATCEEILHPRRQHDRPHRRRLRDLRRLPHRRKLHHAPLRRRLLQRAVHHPRHLQLRLPGQLDVPVLRPFDERDDGVLAFVHQPGRAVCAPRLPLPAVERWRLLSACLRAPSGPSGAAPHRPTPAPSTARTTSLPATSTAATAAARRKSRTPAPMRDRTQARPTAEARPPTPATSPPSTAAPRRRSPAAAAAQPARARQRASWPCWDWWPWADAAARSRFSAVRLRSYPPACKRSLRCYPRASAGAASRESSVHLAEGYEKGADARRDRARTGTVRGCTVRTGATEQRSRCALIVVPSMDCVQISIVGGEVHRAIDSRDRRR